MMAASKSKSPGRTAEQLREHYELEKLLADRLRHATKEERRYLYNELYDELHRKLPHHPLMARKADEGAKHKLVARQIRLLRHFLKPDFTFLEVGPGDCSLAFEAAKYVKKVYAVDVSAEIASSASQPANFELIISDGTSVPVPPKSVDFVYSNQLMEHLHPDDAQEQLYSIYQALKPGGAYLCMTPNPLSGPHDVSRHFDQVATGFHLKEYTTTDLAQTFRAAGFSKAHVFVEVGERILMLPILPITGVERALALLPYKLRKPIAKHFPVRKLLGKIIATK